MANAYRYYDPAPVNLNTLGLQPVAGGALAFYEINTTTPKGTWSDPAMTIPNQNPVPLDSSGRANTNVFLAGAYSVRLLDALGAVIWTRNVTDGSQGGAVIPALVAGQYLTNDGSTLLWAEIRQLPDATGSTGQVPVTNGAGYTLQNLPTTPTLPIVTTNNSIKINDILDQWGAGSIPASGTQIASTTITFPTPYIVVPDVKVNIARGSGVVAAGYIGDIGVTASTTGATISWDLGIDDVRSQYNLTSPLPFTWRAVGKVAS